MQIGYSATSSCGETKQPSIFLNHETDSPVLALMERPAEVYLARLTPRSRKTMLQALNVIARALSPESDVLGFQWETLTYRHTIAIRTWLISRYAPATVNRMLSAVKSVLHEARKLELMSAEACLAACDVPSVREHQLPSGRALTQYELGTLMDVCLAEGGEAGIRDAALIAILYGTGVRRSEAAGFDVQDYDRVNDALKVRAGKGNKDRIVPVVNGARLALLDYLALRGNQEGPLFYRLDRKRRLIPYRLESMSIWYVLKQRRKEAGVESFTPHDLRRTMIGDLLEAGGDIATVQKIVGHENVATTAKYDRRGEATKRRVAELITVPYTSPNRGSR